MTESTDADAVAGPDRFVPGRSTDATVGDRADDIAARRTALRDLAAMIGVEVFY